MARRAREIADGGIYHIYNKINEEKFLLADDNIKDMFVKVVKEAKVRKKYGIHIQNLTVMDNHVHLLITMDRGQSLARAMQWVFSVFAMRYNRLLGRKGHLWIGRYKSVLIKSSEAFWKTFEYICNNPVKAGLVARAEDYQWGFYGLMNNEKYKGLLEVIGF